MKTIRRIGFIFMIIAAFAAFFACTDTPPAHPDEDDDEPVCEHILSDYTVTEEPTETAVGTADGVCSECGETVSVFIPKLSSEQYEVSEKPATCLENGERVYSSAYGEFRVTTSATGHNYVITSVKEATCVEEGETIYECARCGDVKREIADRTAHAYAVAEEVKATCDDKGFVRYVCSECGDEVIVNGVEYGHEYGEGTYFAATCPDKGYTLYVCGLCGAEKYVYDDGPEHVYEGGTGICLNCGAICGHVFDGYDCTLCGLNIEEKVSSLGYYHYDADCDGVSDVGEKVYFGFYPKSIASEESLIKTLSSSVPENGIYTVDGKRYVKEELDQRYAAYAHFSDGSPVASKIYKDNGYFYRIEPILWTITAAEDGKVLLASDYAVEVSDYLGKGGYRYDATSGEYLTADGSGYACDWGSSDLRSYLNGEFVATAFDERQRGMIAPCVNDNGTETNYYKDKAHADGADTEDFVFVAAYGELFGTDEATEGSEKRIVSATDYAIGTGVGLGGGYSTGAVRYYTRSAGKTSDSVGVIGVDGSFATDGALYAETDSANGGKIDGIGVVPRLWLDIAE
ncbi:MAG: DUF6273 domain-containing protein [Christensenellales bacterium]